MATDLLTETDRETAAEISRLMEQSGALLFGDFTLASGRQSPYYFDSKKLTLAPDGALLVARRMVAKLDQFGISYIGGTAYGAIPIVSQAVLYSRLRPGPPIRAFYHRREGDVKKHGTKAKADGQFPLNDVPVAIIEDVVTTGESLLEAIEKAKADGYNVTHAMTLVDRDEGGRKYIEEKGYHFWAMCRIDRSGGQVRVVCDGE